MILVFGATGQIGGHVATTLIERKVPIRVFVRNAKTARYADLPGVEVAIGDLGKSETIERALTGVDRIFLLSTNQPNTTLLQANVVGAARRMGWSGQIVKISGGSYIGPDSPVPIGREHWQVERAIEESGRPYTFLRPSFFMQGVLRTIAPQVAGGGGRIRLPLRNARISMVDARDVAAVAVSTLTESGHEGKVYDVTGPEALSHDDLAATLGRLLARPIRYQNIPLWLFRLAARARRTPAWEVEHGAKMMSQIFVSGLGSAVTSVVADIAHKEPITFEQFAREHLAAFGG